MASKLKLLEMGFFSRKVLLPRLFFFGNSLFFAPSKLKRKLLLPTLLLKLKRKLLIPTLRSSYSSTSKL